MSEGASRYTADLNLRGVNDAHILAIGRVPANSRVLDLGVADGSVATMLRDMGCRVWGVELDPLAAAAAAEVCEDVAVADLNSFDFAEHFGDQRFDVVLMLDVLEHLSDPGTVLRRVSAVVDEGGWGVISLPNVAHLSLRLSLLRGHFTYTDMGLLDRTHMRFFDREAVDDLMDEAKWGIFDLARVTRKLGTTEIQLDDVDPDVVRELEADPEALTYQFILSVAPLGSPVLDRPPPLPAAVAQDALLEAITRMGEMEEEIRALRQALPEDLLAQLDAIHGASTTRRAHLRDLLATMQENSRRLRDALSG